MFDLLEPEVGVQPTLSRRRFCATPGKESGVLGLWTKKPNQFSTHNTILGKATTSFRFYTTYASGSQPEPHPTTSGKDAYKPILTPTGTSTSPFPYY